MSKTYTNKSNAARAAKKANNGTLDGPVLKGTEGAYYYEAPKMNLDEFTAQIKASEARLAAPANLSASMGTPTAAGKRKPGKKAPAPKVVPLAHTQRAAAATSTGPKYRIEKDRDTQNGITRPSAGTKCGDVWAFLDKAAKGNPASLTLAGLKAVASDQGFNVTNAVIEFYRWRRFNGIVGRQ